MIHIAIVEDEEMYSKQLNDYVKRYCEESGAAIKVTFFTDGDEIVLNYSGNYDIILMDIQMRFMDGMTAAEKIRQLDNKVIIMFITNMTQYAIRGYQVDALDYMVKPVEYFSFSQKMSKAIERLKTSERRYISITTDNGMKKLDIDEILYVESFGHYLNYETFKGVFQTRGTMKNTEENLNDPKLTEKFSPEQLKEAAKHSYDALKQCCPKGMYYIGIEYECSKNYDLIFYSRQYLKSQSETHQGNSHFLMMRSKPDRETGTHGLPLKGCAIQTPVSPDTAKIPAELFLYHERVAEWTETIP